MALIQTLNKASGDVIRTYQSKKGNITHVLTNDILGARAGKRIVNCDSFGNPKKIIDFVPGYRKDVYIKAEDGSTILQKGKQLVNLAHVAFSNICENIFK